MSGLNPDEGLLFYLCKFPSSSADSQMNHSNQTKLNFLVPGIHYENMAKMGSKMFIEQELVPGVIASLMKNSSQSDTTIKVIQEQYFGNVDYGDAKHFVPRFSQVQ